MGMIHEISDQDSNKEAPKTSLLGEFKSLIDLNLSLVKDHLNLATLEFQQAVRALTVIWVAGLLFALSVFTILVLSLVLGIYWMVQSGVDTTIVVSIAILIATVVLSGLAIIINRQVNFLRFRATMRSISQQPNHDE